MHKYELSVLTIEDIKKNKLFNKNVIIFESEKIRNELDNSFFSSNNVVVFSSSKNTLISENNNLKTKFFNKPIKLEKFLDNINNYLLSSSIKFKDIEISGELLTNVNNKKSQKITSLEKKILLELAEKKKLKRDYFLENILEVKKDTETKTIESHLTRIRKKLSNIKGETQVISKEDFFYLKI